MFDSYQVEKKYVDCAKLMKERDLGEINKGQKDRRHVTKRGNFLEDEQKLHKLIPGPGQYAYTLDWPEKSKLKIHYPDDYQHKQQSGLTPSKAAGRQVQQPQASN